MGARVTVWSGGLPQTREVRAGSSYGSQDSLTQLFGLGTAAHAAKIEVRWPGGGVETWTDIAGDRLLDLKQGAGTTAAR